jgi:hypothetical protein
VRLSEHGIDQGRFAVIDVRDDGDVSNIGPLTKWCAPYFVNGVGRQMCVHTCTLFRTKKDAD